MMFVIFVQKGREPSESEQTLKRSIDLVAKTRTPRTERQQGMFSERHQANIRLVKDADVIVQCYGAHILRTSDANLETSRWLTWDDHPIDHAQLVALLDFELDSDTLKPLEADTMHKPRVKEPALFDVGVHDLDDEDDE